VANNSGEAASCCGLAREFEARFKTWPPLRYNKDVRVTVTDVASALALRPPIRVDEPVASRAAVAVILREGEAGMEILFIRRAERAQDPWSGQVGFPGGRVEPEDRDLDATARRETWEEVGINLARDADLLGSLDEIRAMARGRPVDLAIAPFVFHLRRGESVCLSEEVTSVHWLSLDALLGPEHHGRFEYRHEEGTVDLPCLRLGDFVIWGLTYRMFGGLRKRLVALHAGGLHAAS
jgi:8-oxo-dGTP pyrophosphatase MutT (NUDIX family)